MTAPPRSTVSKATDRAHDLELVRAARGGSAAATERLLTRLECVPRILFARNRRAELPLGEGELADVVQDSLVVLWEKLDAYEGRAALETWVYRVCVLEWLNAVRRRARRPARAIEETPEPESPEPDDRLGIDEAALVNETLERLGPPDADVIRHKHFDGWTFEEIGRRLRTSPNTIKFWYYRGMDRLRERLLPTFRGGRH